MDRIQKLAERVDKLEKEKPIVVYRHDKDMPRLASAIVFASFVALFITGLLLAWHWGWLIAIGVIGVIVTISTFDGI